MLNNMFFLELKDTPGQWRWSILAFRGKNKTLWTTITTSAVFFLGFMKFQDFLILVMPWTPEMDLVAEHCNLAVLFCKHVRSAKRTAANEYGLLCGRMTRERKFMPLMGRKHSLKSAAGKVHAMRYSSGDCGMTFSQTSLFLLVYRSYGNIRLPDHSATVSKLQSLRCGTRAG